MKITVIGGAGFVGTNLCQALKDRLMPFEIIDLKMSRRFPAESKIGDVRNLKSLARTISGDLVVNLAAVHRDDVLDPNDYYQTNVIGAQNLSEICSEKKIKKIVFTSSVAVYGFAEPGTGEDGPINPFNEYGKTKFQAEEVLRELHADKDKSLIIVRPTVIFGEGNRGNVYNLFNQIFQNKFVMIGSGKNVKSMAYIENIVAFLLECIKADVPYAVYNYVDTPDLNMNKLISLIKKQFTGSENVGLRVPYSIGLVVGLIADVYSKVTSRKSTVSAIRVKKFCASTSFSSKKSELGGFSPPLSLEAGLIKTLVSEFHNADCDREIFYTE